MPLHVHFTGNLHGNNKFICTLRSWAKLFLFGKEIEFLCIHFFVAVDLIIIGSPYVKVTDKVAVVKIWLFTSSVPYISLFKNSRQIDVTDKNKYGFKATLGSLELMLYNPKQQDYGEYTVSLWTTASRVAKDLTVTLPKPLGRLFVSVCFNKISKV